MRYYVSESSYTYIFKYILLIMLLQFSQFFLLYSASALHLPTLQALQHFPSASALSSCPWIVHMNSLASPFPIPFLTYPHYFMPTNYASYSLYLFPLIIPCPTPQKTLHVISISLILFCSSCFLSFLFLGSVVDSCEFVVILLFIVLIFFYFLGKSMRA